MLFNLLNGELTFSFFDWYMPMITNERFWMPFILGAWILLLIFGGTRGRVLGVMILLGVGATDIISSHLIKKTVRRQRPCVTEPSPRMLIGKKTSLSFPSSHAANSTAFAWIILFSQGAKFGVPFVLLALSVAYSRIYVGVHYPLDALVGTLLGILTAYITVKIGQRFQPQKEPVKSENPTQTPSQSTA